jgi:hypothetical protein
VKEQLRRACKECDGNLMNDILQHTEPIPLSAEMALLSELPMSKVIGSEAYEFAWKRACDIFEISNGLQMRKKSHIDNLIAAVRRVVEKEKSEILFRKPMNAILAAGNKKKTDTEKGIQECTMLINTLNQPDDELEEKQENLRKAYRRLNKKIDTLGDDIESSMRDLVRRGRNQLEDDVESACRKMDGIIDSLGRFSSPQSILPQLERETQTLITRTLKRDVENVGREAKGKIRDHASDFFGEVEDLLMRYVEDFDSRDFVKSIDKEIVMDIEDSDIFSYANDEAEEDYGLTDFMFDFLNGASWGLLGGATNFLSHADYQQKMHHAVNEMRSADVTEFLDSIFKQKDAIINKLRERFIEELVSPLEEEIDDIIKNKSKREQELQSYQHKLDDLLKVRALIDEQLQIIENIKE